MIELTPAALEAVSHYRTNLQIPQDHLLRIGIKQKNAQEKILVIGFDLPTEADKIIQVQGVDVMCHPGHVFYFAGMQIDFIVEEERSGFKLIEKKKPQ